MENQKKIMLAKNLQASEKFGDSLLTGAICLDVLDQENVQDLIFEFEGKQYLKIKVVKRKQATAYQKTHYIEVDQYVPDSAKS